MAGPQCVTHPSFPNAKPNWESPLVAVNWPVHSNELIGFGYVNMHMHMIQWFLKRTTFDWPMWWNLSRLSLDSLAIFTLNGWARVNQHLLFSIKSPCLWASFHMQTSLTLRSLKSSMKCWNSVFNTQGSRLITVPVQAGAMKIYVAAVEALKKKEREGSKLDETQFTTQKKRNGAFLSFSPPEC